MSIAIGERSNSSLTWTVRGILVSDGKRAREQWYLAEIVEEIRVETDPRNVVHINLVLVRAHSKSDAWAKAIELGRGGEANYTNPAGKRVTVTFSGTPATGCDREPA